MRIPLSSGVVYSAKPLLSLQAIHCASVVFWNNHSELRLGPRFFSLRSSFRPVVVSISLRTTGPAPLRKRFDPFIPRGEKRGFFSKAKTAARATGNFTLHDSPFPKTLHIASRV